MNQKKPSSYKSLTSKGLVNASFPTSLPRQTHLMGNGTLLVLFSMHVSGECGDASYAGQPSKVDTVNRAIMAMSTLSKLKSLLCHCLFSMVGWFTSPSLYIMKVPLGVGRGEKVNWAPRGPTGCQTNTVAPDIKSRGVLLLRSYGILQSIQMAEQS